MSARLKVGTRKAQAAQSVASNRIIRIIDNAVEFAPRAQILMFVGASSLPRARAWQRGE